jgi:hypothetical protein
MCISPDRVGVIKGHLHNKSLSIKGSLIFHINEQCIWFYLYIKGSFYTGLIVNNNNNNKQMYVWVDTDLM